MEKICVFCGTPAKNKNKEHVLPQWLMRLTGKVPRNVYIGRDWNSPNLTKRIFDVKSFAFPACEACNSKYSSLEVNVQATMSAMFERQPLRADAIGILLDWFDKVRIGLWLGLRYLNKNHQQVEPQFAIGSRLATADRVLFVYRDEGRLDGLGIAGVDSPVFHVMPSCLVLIVNSLHFFNVSRVDLLARRMGFPYLINKQLPRDREGIVADGTGQIELPLIPFSVPPGGSYFYQVVVPPPNRACLAEQAGAYAASHVREWSQVDTPWLGKVVQVHNEVAQPYSDEASMGWMPPSERPKIELMAELAVANAAWQEALYLDQPTFDLLTSEQVAYVRQRMDRVLGLHRRMSEHLKGQIASATDVVHGF